MIKTAKVIDTDSRPDEIGLFDKVVIYIEEDDEEQTIELVTTLRQNGRLVRPATPIGASCRTPQPPNWCGSTAR